jgi:hypothetical protein
VVKVTVAQVTERELLCHRILAMPDESFGLVRQYVDGIEAHEPNEETIAALMEAENLENLTTCTDLQDMLTKCGV